MYSLRVIATGIPRLARSKSPACWGESGVSVPAATVTLLTLASSGWVAGYMSLGTAGFGGAGEGGADGYSCISSK